MDQPRDGGVLQFRWKEEIANVKLLEQPCWEDNKASDFASKIAIDWYLKRKN